MTQTLSWWPFTPAACSACKALADDIERLESEEAFGRVGGRGRQPVDVEDLSPVSAEAVAVLPGCFRKNGMFKSALKGYAGALRVV
jgi:hypothetical protein